MQHNASALQFELSKLQSDQPNSNELTFTFGKNKTKITAKALPMPLSKKHSEPTANKLNFELSRRLGTLVLIDNTPKRKMKGVAAWFVGNITTKKPIALTLNSLAAAKHIAYDLNVTKAKTLSISYCSDIKNDAFTHVANNHSISIGDFISISMCYQQNTTAFVHIANSQYAKLTATKNYQTCKLSISLKSVNFHNATVHLNSPTVGFKRCLKPVYKRKSISRCNKSTIVESVPVLCRYFPIPEPPPRPPAFSCRVRPPSNQLDFDLYRIRNQPSSSLPINFTCWHDQETLPLPIRDTYMIFTEFTATIGGISVDPLSFNIKTDVNSYCWSGDVDISPDDYEKIKNKLAVERGSEPIVNVSIGTQQFAFIAEEASRVREFAKHTHNIAGRSITARLGADYAVANDRMFDQDNYASQIVNQQLADLPYSIEDFEVVDWLIPANTYSISNKTPIAVIADIADAVGGFVQSHDYDAKLSIKKRWKINAWELATATPDVIIPYAVILKLSEKPRQNTRYNSISLFGNTEGFGVYRRLEAKDLQASTLNNDLFTASNVAIAKGSAVLSHSGKHNIYQLKIPFSEEIKMAELGQIWQVDDIDGAWRGVVAALDVSVELVDGAPEPMQIVTLDRYIDK